MKEQFPLTGISSVAMHTGNTENDAHAHITPIYATSTFVFDTAEQGMERFKSIDKEKVKAKTILDIGYGNGDFLKVCRSVIESYGGWLRRLLVKRLVEKFL